MRKFNKFFVLLAFCGLSIGANAQASYYYGIDVNFKNVIIDSKTTYCGVVYAVSVNLPAYEAGVKIGDVIVAIDGQPVNYESWNFMRTKPTTTLSVKRLGNAVLTLKMSGVPCLSDNFAPESYYAWFDITGMSVICVTDKTLNIEPITIMSDPDTDFFKYSTFDFEFSEQNTMQQKEIAPKIEEYLVAKGLKRNREKPDILIFIEFFSDRREQYVPPTQQIGTRYGVGYNFFTKSFYTTQNISSETVGDYTRVNYLSKIAISMVDVKKMLAGKSGDAKIWQGEYEVVYKERANHKKFSEAMCLAMLSSFPFTVSIIKMQKYYYTGIIFDNKIAGKVNGVVPNSPAYNAGIRAGNIIKKSSWKPNTMFKIPYSKYERKSYSIYNQEDFAL